MPGVIAALLGASQAALHVPENTVQVAGIDRVYVWPVALSFALILGLILDNRVLAKRLDAQPKITIDKPVLIKQAPSNKDPSFTNLKVRVSVRNDSKTGGSSATRVRAWAPFSPVGETHAQYEFIGAGFHAPMPMRADLPWVTGGDDAGFVELNPSDEKQLAVVRKYLSDGYAYAFDVYRSEDGDGRDYQILRGEYDVAVTVNGSNFPPSSATFRLTNYGPPGGMEFV